MYYRHDRRLHDAAVRANHVCFLIKRGRRDAELLEDVGAPFHRFYFSRERGVRSSEQSAHFPPHL